MSNSIEEELADAWVLRDRQNVGLFPAAYTGSFMTEKRCEEKYGHRTKKCLIILSGERAASAYIRKSDCEETAEKMLEEDLKNPLYVDKLYQESIIAGQKLLEYIDGVQGLSSKNKLGLLEIYKNFVKFYTDFQFANGPAWLVLANRLHDYLNNYLAEKTETKQAREVLTLLTTPTDPSFAKRQELKFLSLIRTIQKDKELPEIFNLGDTKGIERNLQGRDILADIIEHAEEFGWIPFDYIGPDLWETEHFIDAISTFIKQGKDAENEIKRIEREDAILKERQLKAKQSLQIDDSTYRLFKDSRLLMLLQDMKKEISSKAHVWLQKRLLTEISNRTGIETRLLRNLTEKEFGELLSGKPMNIESLRERAERSVLVMENGEFSVLLGEEARDYERMFTISFEDLNEVKGTVASLGKAHGTARVLASAKEIGRVREGDILITTMTTPDYVPAMKKAAAIVTDEGGVTCHAAIVARELGIPCVIATRIATKIFKDGEEVEVDAVHGIVKKM